MEGEKDITPGAGIGSLARPTPSSPTDEKVSSDSDSTAEAGTVSEGPITTANNTASYAAIKPAATNPSAPTRPLSSRSLRSTRSLAHTRSHNGHGCDDFEEEEDDEDPSSSSEDPEAGGVQRSRSKDKDPFEVAFEGGNADPWNPRSMSTPRKWLITALASSGSFCVTCASSIYTSTYTQMDAEFGCSKELATLGLSTFVLGIALGPAWSPLSEFYGRRPIYLAAFMVFTLFIIPCAVARNIETVIVSRFFQGFAGSAFLSVSGGTVSDLFTPETMHHPLTLFTAAPFLAPSLGPLIGGFINSNVNWRWTHYVLIIWAFCMFLAICFFVPETYRKLLSHTHTHTQKVDCTVGQNDRANPAHADPVILRKKAEKKRKDTGDERWKAPVEKANKSVFRTVGHALLRPFQILAFEPMALILDLYSAILLGILYLFFGAFPFVFEGVYGFNLWQTGLTFLGLMLGMLIGAMTSGVWQKVRMRLVEKNARITGVRDKSEPEFRLPPVIVGSAFVTVGLFWFAWTTLSWVHWIVPIIGSGIFGIGVSYPILICVVVCERRGRPGRAAGTRLLPVGY